MGKKRSDLSDLLGKPLKRRQALGGLGAIVAAGPIAGACSSEDGAGDPSGNGTGGAATGGSAPTGGSNPTGGSAPTGGAKSAFGGSPSQPTGGSSPTGGAPPQSTGGTTGGTPASTGGGGASGGTVGKGGSGGANGGASGGTPNGGSGGGSGALAPPAWDDVPMCTASKTDGARQGPFFIHDKEKSTDVDMLRQDIRGRYNMDAEPGIEMQLHLRILSSKSTDCNGTPVKDAEIYIWHTDAQGYYSGFGMPGEQTPDVRYVMTPNQNDLDTDDRFCRGYQLTDANGVVSFRSIYPGWYNGRDLHIHFVALKKGSSSKGRTEYNGAEHLFTTQFYFDPMLTDMIHKQFEPYKRRTTIDAYQGAIQGDEGGNSGLRAKASLQNNIVIAQMQILLDPKV